MERKKLDIVSSYHELCGNATYTEVLKNEFTKYYDVDVMALKVKWLGSSQKKLRKLAEEHIDDICEKIKNYDYVNIQFEAGLYGTHPNEIVRRVKKLIDASKNLIFTMHRVDLCQSLLDKKILRGFLSISFFKNLKRWRQQNYFPRIYKKLVEYMKRESVKKNIQIIVHSHRDYETIKYAFDFDNVHDFPLTFLNKNQREIYPKISNKKEFYKNYGIPENMTTIGLFGFIADYKQHSTVINAMKFLPENYILLIFGSQHPMSIVPYETINPYIKILLKTIEKLELTKRVFFLGSLDDESFIKALYCCDFTVLPYIECNQGGSGIAALTIETKIKAIFSNNISFSELKRYFPNCFESFDIGNYQELASKILGYRHDYTSNIDKCLEIYNIENNILLHKRLFEETK